MQRQLMFYYVSPSMCTHRSPTISYCRRVFDIYWAENRNWIFVPVAIQPIRPSIIVRLCLWSRRWSHLCWYSRECQALERTPIWQWANRWFDPRTLSAEQCLRCDPVSAHRWICTNNGIRHRPLNQIRPCDRYVCCCMHRCPFCTIRIAVRGCRPR